MKTTPPLIDCPHQDCSAVEMMSGFETTHTLRYVLSVQGDLRQGTCHDLMPTGILRPPLRTQNDSMTTPATPNTPFKSVLLLLTPCSPHTSGVNSQHNPITVKYFILVTPNSLASHLPSIFSAQLVPYLCYFIFCAFHLKYTN